MTLKERVGSFAELGEILRNSLSGSMTRFTSQLENLIDNQQFKNPWFTPENVRLAIKSIADELTYENLNKWTARYPALTSAKGIFNVGVVMAGNIPLVGFHDFLSVLITGNKIISKTSSKDSELIVFISDMLCEINSGFREKIIFTDDFLTGFDIVIATGGDNSSRYFEYYFGKYPHIIRKNRNSVAVITGDENDGELKDLGIDVFSYFGLGCRNVSKIYIPEGYDLEKLFRHWTAYSFLVSNNKYANNYDFNKAVFMVNREKFTDTGYLLLRENQGISSPVAVLYYEYFNSLDYMVQKNEMSKDRIQCITGRNHVPFGHTQMPHLWDYADGIDTIEFLLKKNMPGIM
jgi:hypothetical protein